MIVRIGKTHTLTRDIHTDTRCLGRRLQLVGNIGFPGEYKTSYKHFTNAFIQTQTLIYL